MGMPDPLDAKLQGLEERLNAHMQAQEERLNAQMSALEDRLVQFMAREFETVRRDLTALERQVGFLREITAGIQSQMAAMVKQDGTRELELTQIRGAQAGQQKAIEDLYQRVKRLEQGNGSAQKS